MNWIFYVVEAVLLIFVSVSAIPASEYNALWSLFNSTQGPHWRWHKNMIGEKWNFSSPASNPCIWMGISCISSSVVSLSLQAFNLTGTLPNEIGNLSLLKTLDLSQNRLHGTIPDEIGRLQFLHRLYLFDNRLQGNFSSQLTGLPNITHLDLSTNVLGGSIPTSIGSMSGLKYLALYNNNFTGTFPVELSNLINLHSFLGLANNNFHGTIPPQFCGHLSNLRILSLSLNLFSGNLSWLSNCSSSLISLHLNRNKFTGTLPSLHHLSSLVQLQLQSNSLNGEIESLPGLLEDVSLSNNNFEGCFPFASIASSIQILDISFNSFHCQLQFPSGGSEYPFEKLLTIDISNNKYSGTIGSFFSRANQLQSISLANNFFSGNMHIMFNFSTQFDISFVNLGNNHLKGTIPSNIFLLRNLTSLVLSNNCISGGLPATLCKAKKLTTLVLDGMNSNSYCIKPLWGFGSKNIYISPDIIDSMKYPSRAIKVPSCVFTLPNISTIHLSGLGIMGSLPNDIEPGMMPPSLQDLCLSFNFLTGTVPSAFFQHLYWNQFDLSFNRFSGTLQDMSFAINNNTGYERVSSSYLNELQLQNSIDLSYLNEFQLQKSLNLSINRFSGHIPISFTQLSDIKMNILDGNIFSCSIISSKSQLPQNDGSARNYQCGSNQFDIYIIVWATIVAMMLFSVVVSLYFSRAELMNNQISKKLVKFIDVLRNFVRIVAAARSHLPESPNRISMSSMVSEQFVQKAVYCWIRFILTITFIGIFVLCPFYAILSSCFGTYANQYGYIVSAAFIKGLTPALCMLLVFTALLGLYCREWMAESSQSPLGLSQEYKLQSSFSSMDSVPVSASGSMSASLLAAPNRGPVLKICAIALVNAIVVIIANAFYVYLLSNNVPSEYLNLMTMALSIFKLTCSGTLLGFDVNTISTEFVTFVLMSLLTFNNIFVPYIAESFVNRNCFYYATMEPPPEVHSSILLSQCTMIINQDEFPSKYLLPSFFTACIPSMHKVSYHPSFTYSYQCSSSLITNFSSVFLLRYLLSGVFQPMWIQVVTRLMQRKDIVTILPVPLLKMLLFVEPKAWQAIRELKMSESLEEKYFILRKWSQPLASVSIFDSRKFCASVVVDIGMLMTFGVLFPPVGVAICLSLIMYLTETHWLIEHVEQESQFSSLSKLKSEGTSSLASNPDMENKDSVIEERVSVLQVQQCHRHLLENMYSELQHITEMKLMFRPIPYMAVVIAMFWSFTLFDTLGDEVGVMKAYWIVLVMIVAVPVSWGLFYRYLYGRVHVIFLSLFRKEVKVVQAEVVTNPIINNGKPIPSKQFRTFHQSINNDSISNSEMHNGDRYSQRPTDIEMIETRSFSSHVGVVPNST